MPKTAKPFTAKFAKNLLPKRTRFDNKTTAGKCLVIAGSKKMMGAAILATTAAARAGAGYTFLMSESNNFDIQENPDFIFLGDIKTQLAKINFNDFSSIAIGPGMTDLVLIKNILQKLFKNRFKKVVIDASALSAIAKFNVQLQPEWIITPHEGELAKLIKKNSTSIKRNRDYFLHQAQAKYGCIVVLKGHDTLISNGEKYFRVTAGNSSLAKAGTGDVLTGMIAGFLAQGLENLQAACLGNFCHGLCSQVWTKSGNDHLSLLASDLLPVIPKVFAKLRHSR